MARNKSPVMMDPALLKYYNMVNNRYKYFRWTPRNAWITTVYAIIIPGALTYVAYNTDGKWDLRGKTRGDPLREF